MNDNMFSQMDFGPAKKYLEDDDVTDISYSNGGQVWLKTLSKGIYRVDDPEVNNAFMEKLAFQCSNVMGKTFNMAHPFLDAESAELRLNFVHDSIAKNGIACVMRKTPAKIRLEKEKIIKDDYISLDIHDLLIKCIEGHCNIIVCGETGSGKTEFVKYLASKIKENEKVITIEDTLELHLDRIFPTRDIVAMKTNNIASYSDVLVTCMRQNPKWILLSEVRSAEAVLAVRNSISSGHYILSTIHADKAASIPDRMYSLLETNQDIEQFLKSIYRYIQLGIYIRGYHDKKTGGFRREIGEVTEFHVTKDNRAEYNVIYRRTTDGDVIRNNPSSYLIDYLDVQGVKLTDDMIHSADVYGSEKKAIDTEEELKNLEQMDKEAQNNEKSVTDTVAQTTKVETPVVEPKVETKPEVSAKVEEPKVESPTVAPTKTEAPVASTNPVATPAAPAVKPETPAKVEAPVQPTISTNTATTNAVSTTKVEAPVTLAVKPEVSVKADVPVQPVAPTNTVVPTTKVETPVTPVVKPETSVKVETPAQPVTAATTATTNAVPTTKVEEPKPVVQATKVETPVAPTNPTVEVLDL